MVRKMRENWQAQVRELIGEAAWQLLCEAFPDKSFIIPKSINENHFLASAIGLELAQNLCREFAGIYITIPISAAKNARIIADLQKSDSPVIIAKRYFVTRRHVEKLRRKMETAAREQLQGNLF